MMPAVQRAEAIEVARVSPDDAAWRRLAERLRGAHVAHAPEWADIVWRAYGHTSICLMARDGHGGEGLLPAIVVKRPIFGTVVASMPFLDGGGPCVSPGSSRALGTALIDALVAEARRQGADSVELRGADRLDVGTQAIESKVNMILPLPNDTDALWKRLDKDVRNQVRKAEKSGLTFEMGGLEKIPAFYRVHATRMRELGSPVHSESFFHAILHGFGANARVAIVRKDSTPIGGLVALAFKDSLIVPWASCLKEHFRLCPNMLLYWETIRGGLVEGFRAFDFGRSTRQSGTYKFKVQWGAVEHPLFWYTIPVHRRQPVHESVRRDETPWVVRAWQHLPLVVTRQLGPHIRKYLIQ